MDVRDYPSGDFVEIGRVCMTCGGQIVAPQDYELEREVAAEHGVAVQSNQQMNPDQRLIRHYAEDIWEAVQVRLGTKQPSRLYADDEAMLLCALSWVEKMAAQEIEKKGGG